MRLARGWWRNGRIILLTAVSMLLLSATLPAQNLENENRRLREELEKARREVQSLREENARLKSAPVPAPVVSTPAAGTTVAAPASTPAAVPVTPSSVVVPPPIADGSTVSIEQLLVDYRASGLAGDARYKGRHIRLEGDVHSFKKQFVGLGWIVELRGGDKLGLVRCAVSFPGVSDFRPSPDNARILEGRHPFKAWLPLLQMGEKVVLDGICTGIDGAVVEMKDCHPAS